MLCIICKKDIYGKKFTKEHIFPEAIGGTLTIKRVCKSCNDKMGSKIDAPMVAHPFIGFMRNELQIPGKNGQISEPMKNAKITDKHGNPVKLFSGNQPGKFYPYHPPKAPTVTETSKDKYRIKWCIDYRDHRRVNRMMEKEKKKLGPSAEINDVRQVLIIDPPPLLNAEVIIDQGIRPGLLKIAYELACYWLNDDYSNDFTGENIRKALYSEAYEHSNPYIDQFEFPIALIENPMYPVSEDPPEHIGYLINTENMLQCYIKLFNVFEALIVVSHTPEIYRPFNDDYLVINHIPAVSDL